MTPEERADRMLERLPRLLQTGPNIRRILEALGGDFAEMERATRRLLESRWFMLARGFGAHVPLDEKARSDLGAIGALFNMHPGPGESDEYFRRHLAALLQLHSVGLSRATSLLHLVSFAYLAEQPPTLEVLKVEDEKNPEIIRFRTMGRFKVPEGTDDGGKESFREIQVELVDNPLSSASATFPGVGASQQMAVVNGGLEQSYPDINIKATNGAIHVPMLHHEESGLDLIYLGTLEEEQTLAIGHDKVPMVNGVGAKGVLLVSNPTRFAGSILDRKVFHFNSDDARFSKCEVTIQSLPLRLGENRWHYRTLTRSELHAYLVPRPELLGYLDQALEKTNSPPADITFSWMEVTPAALELRIPANYVPPHYRKKSDTGIVLDYVSFFRDIRAALEYGRAAGVRATVGFNVQFQPEVVTMTETLGMTVDFAFSEEERAVDHGLQGEGSVNFVDTFQEPTERLNFGGIFDHTRFDSSWIQSPEEAGVEDLDDSDS